MRISFLVALGAAMVVGCSVPAEDVGTGEQQVLSDAVSITQRPDGRFDVFCRGRDGAPDYAQTVPASAIHDNSVCSPPAPPGPNTFAVAARSFSVPVASNTVLEQWGADAWKGFASFDASVTGTSGYSFSAKVVDGTGASYPLSATTTRFERLPTPIKILASAGQYANASVKLSRASIEVSETTPLPALSTKYSGTSATSFPTLGAELSGAAITIKAEARFFANFTNGNSCSRATLIDAANQIVTLDPSSFSRHVTLKAPVRVQAQSTCISSRLAAPENATSDVVLAITPVAIVTPAP